MSEIKTDLIMLRTGEVYQAGDNDYVITDDHTHCDILRFVVADLGLDETKFLLETLEV